MINAKNVVVFDKAGIPSIMVKFEKRTNADLFGGSNQTHPAFIIDGEEVDEIYISKYPCTIINGLPYSLPYMPPATDISFEKASEMCFEKGEGWHLMTAPEWGLVTLESARGELPRGNTDYGKSHSCPDESGTVYGGGKTLAGSGPSTWAHDGTPFGVYDLCGNVWEMLAGLRLMDGRFEIIENNNAANRIDMSRTSPLWKPILCDGKSVRVDVSRNQGLKITNAPKNGSPTWWGDPWENVKLDIDPPEIVKALAIYPLGEGGKESYLFADESGERLPIRGGHWGNSADAGVFALFLGSLRSSVGACLGFRAAFYRKTANRATE